jgi:ABC-type antimicrobial peptide transport system permease subunit
MFFAIPGMCLGLLFAYLTNSIVALIFFESAQEITSYELHISALILSICLGFLIPVFSNYLPIRRALSKTLRDSLDLYHRSVADLYV